MVDWSCGRRGVRVVLTSIVSYSPAEELSKRNQRPLCEFSLFQNRNIPCPVLTRFQQRQLPRCGLIGVRWRFPGGACSRFELVRGSTGSQDDRSRSQNCRAVPTPLLLRLRVLPPPVFFVRRVSSRISHRPQFLQSLQLPLALHSSRRFKMRF